MTPDTFRDLFPKTTFRLGITMAGAVSAGGYSAGVMCYLLQNFEKWEQAKCNNYKAMLDHALQMVPAHLITSDWIEMQKNPLREAHGFDKRIPMHDVIIEVIGGASAGSLVGALSILSTGYKQIEINANDLLTDQMGKENDGYIFKPGKDLTYLQLENNLVFDTWVNMSEDKSPGKSERRDAFEKLLAVDEADELTKPFALLNASVLERIKKHQLNRIFEPDINVSPPHRPYKRIGIPSFISSDLYVYFSFTSLRGITFSIRFTDVKKSADGASVPAHRMKIHAGMTIFSRSQGTGIEYELDPHEKASAEYLIDCAIASGSFPIGLPPRKLTFSSQYIQDYLKNTIGINNLDMIDLDLDADQSFELAAVDGGTLNNEPFTEVFQKLKLKCENTPDVPALILIDPFPNFESPELEFKYPKGLLDVINGIIGALRGQAMVKDVHKLGHDKDDVSQKNIMGMIFPSRRNLNRDRLKPALATSSLGGFGGFLNKNFRIHDFHLGMKNGQSFIQNYFYVAQDSASLYTSFKDWTSNDARYKVFAINHEINTSAVLFPIIPDMSRLSEDPDNFEVQRNNDIRPSAFPTIHKREVLKYYQPIRKRIFFLLNRLVSSTPKVKTKKQKLWGLDITLLQPLGFLLVLLTIIGFMICLLTELEPTTFWLILLLGVVGIIITGLFILYFLSFLIVRQIGNALHSSKQINIHRDV